MDINNNNDDNNDNNDNNLMKLFTSNRNNRNNNSNNSPIIINNFFTTNNYNNSEINKNENENEKDTKIEQLQSELERVQTELANMRELIMKHCNIAMSASSVHPIIKEKIPLAPELIKECLKYNSVRGDTQLLKAYYLDETLKQNYPIRCISARRYEYLKDNAWTIDISGDYIKEVFAHNLRKTYLSMNKIDEVNDVANDVFLANQKHISKLADPKYQTLLLKSFREFLM
jgi:hypothetical protein